LPDISQLRVTPSYTAIAAQQNAKPGKHLQEFKENIDRLMLAILTISTFAYTLGTAGFGAQAQII
jgi:hypothetical protein